MFTAQKTLFLYAVSPVHMGAGQAIGLIDNPIQREVHTGHPVFAGSGIKGAVRHRFYSLLPQTDNRLTRYFGAESDKASDYAGAVSFSDAQLVLFPVRCTKAGYVYATSPLALARAKRLLQQSGLDTWNDLTSPTTNHCLVTQEHLLVEKINDKGQRNKMLYVEAYELNAKPDEKLKAIATILANYALSDDQDFFKHKIISDLVLMTDDDFGYFVKNATSIEPHVRIVPETGVAKDGGLFYTENLPPESVMIQNVMATAERSKAGTDKAEDVLAFVLDGDLGLNGKLLQVG
ncbi:MAG TPA: type III-B CRISPR module RAMP protein Cmr4, partial [Agitococcus sp.]|nr:type III-B CRISPR module RAMP protein Cmr4 [Agitococcus sp.]